MFKKFLIWINSFFYQKKYGLHSSYIGSTDIREYVEENPLTPVLKDSARLDNLKVDNLDDYIAEVISISLLDIRKKVVPSFGYDFIVSERLAELLQTTNLLPVVIASFKQEGLFVTFVNGSDEIPLPFLKVYLLES